MTRSASSLAKLMALRALREERARVEMMRETARLHQSQRAVADARDALASHDSEMDAAERSFLEFMGMAPVSASDLSRKQDRLLASDHRREALVSDCDAATEEMVAVEQRMPVVRKAWRSRLRERDMLAGIQEKLRREEQTRSESLAELEADDQAHER